MFPSLSVSLKLQSISLKNPEFNLESGLLNSSLLPWVPTAINSAVTIENVKSAAPVDGVEVVEWMQIAAADNAVFDAMAEEYNRLGSQLLSGSGDAYIPGIRVGDLRGVSVTGSTVSSRRYGEVETPQGRFTVPVGGKTTFAKADILAWAALPYAGSIQWNLTLLQWKDLATAPIKDRVRFASSNGLVAPNFFSIPATFAPIRTLKIGMTSDKPQTVAIRGRGTKGAFENVLFEDSFNIDAGESEVTYNVFGFPTAPSFTLELQPEDNTQTVLDYIEIFPPV
jgi:hypothetical protein